ncbi:MAG: DUF2441 domain-containing protein [Bacilli bacterium]|nr:DUF2441 domain-containing protein [Bacilli bacterium]
MQVNSRKMYHFNSPKSHQEIWTIDNEFIVDDNYNASLVDKALKHDYRIKIKDETPALSSVLRYNYKTDFENVSIKHMKMFLEDSMRMLHEANIALRELALEEFRRKYHPELPSRYSSIWVCNKAGLKYWEKTFNSDVKDEDKRDLFKLDLTGTLFKTSDEFLPEFGQSYKSIYETADKYWEPNFKDKHDEKKAEYLFKGKVRVLEKVDYTNMK